MKKKHLFTKLASLTMAVVSMFTMQACSKPDSSGDGGSDTVYNRDRDDATHIVAVVTGGGIGSEWLNESAERFAKKQNEHSYAPNKKGVYIETKPVLGFNTAGLSGTADNMFILLAKDLFTLTADDSVLDITEFVQDTTREGGSLESKMLPGASDMCKGADGKYYALPHMESYAGLNYDRQAFDDCNAYFAADDAVNKRLYSSVFSNGELKAYMVGNADDKKSAGPDGVFGSEDDGLPATLEELLILFDYLKEETDYAPLVYAGEYAYYTNFFLAGLWPALAGTNKMSNYYNVSGELEVIKTDANGNFLFTDESLFPGIDYIKKPQTEVITIDDTNANRVTTMVEKYYAMATLEIMERQGWFSEDTYKQTDHYGAQQAFLFQGKSPKYKKAAMLIETSYWYNESNIAGCFKNYEDFTRLKAEDRDLRFMCLPTRIHASDAAPATGEYANPLLDTARTLCFLNSNLKNKDELRNACLDFLSFLYTDNELAQFTVRTSLSVGMNYSMTDEQLVAMTNFGRRVRQLRDNAKASNVVYNSGKTDMYRANRNELRISDSCDNFWTKFESFDGIDGKSMGGYIGALRLDTRKNSDGTYKLGTQKLFVTNNALQKSRFVMPSKG